MDADGAAYFGIDELPDGHAIRRCDLGDDQLPVNPYTDVVADEGRSLVSPTVIARGEDRFVYFAASDDGVSWRIELAVSHDAGATFTAIDGAVVDIGEPGAFDERSVSQPAVIYDPSRAMFRMWYTATGVLGATSIGYAVSADGVTWHKLDEPVVTREPLGLVELGSPTVIDDGGRLRMWIDGLAPGAVARTIYELENVGVAP